MKKIVLNEEACIGCGACVGIDSEHFEFNDEGYSSVVSQENLDSPALADAIDACPVAIISVEEQDDNTSNVDMQDEMVKSDCECASCECEECHCQDEENAA